MSPTLKAILLGAALATATPLRVTPYGNHTQQDNVTLASLLPEGVAPIFMAQVDDPAAELEKCGYPFPGLVECTRSGIKGQCFVDKGEDCKLGDLVEKVLRAHASNTTIAGVEDYLRKYHGAEQADEGQDASALASKQEDKCEKFCSRWGAMPPKSWFAICMRDCQARCENGKKCP